VDGGRSFVTAELTMTFRAPARVEQPLTARGTLVETGERRAVCRGELSDPDGSLVSEPRAVMAILSPERFEQVVGQPTGAGPFRQVDRST
jgi:acyl-coenzyme A thioesterase PaaI-like protein